MYIERQNFEVKIMELVEPIRDIELIEKVKKILANNGVRDLLLFSLGINTGLRISDILKLKVKDVKNKENVEIIEQKTGKRKRFPIHAVKNLLNDFIQFKSDDEYLFISRQTNGKTPVITRQQAYNIINKACRKAGIIDRIGTHTLRKTFGYHHYKKEKNVALLQEIFNHSAPSITLKYIGINQDVIFESLRDFSL